MVDSTDTKFKHISVEASRNMQGIGETKFVDIRDIDAYLQGHIEDAIRLDNASIPVFLQNTPKQTPVVVYCYRGIASQQVAQFLSEQGFDEVYSMDGGFDAWRKAAG